MGSWNALSLCPPMCTQGCKKDAYAVDGTMRILVQRAAIYASETGHSLAMKCPSCSGWHSPFECKLLLNSCFDGNRQELSLLLTFTTHNHWIKHGSLSRQYISDGSTTIEIEISDKFCLHTNCSIKGNALFKQNFEKIAHRIVKSTGAPIIDLKSTIECCPFVNLASDKSLIVRLVKSESYL